jgi:hypothetical protein
MVARDDGASRSRALLHFFGSKRRRPRRHFDTEQRCNIVLCKNAFCRHAGLGHRQIGAGVDDQFRAIDAA